MYLSAFYSTEQRKRYAKRMLYLHIAPTVRKAVENKQNKTYLFEEQFNQQRHHVVIFQHKQRKSTN